MNAAREPEDLHKLFAQSLNSGDLDALVALYAFDGFLLARSGPARGISEIRKALARYIAMKSTIQLTTRRVIQVEDTALLVGDWRFQGTAADERPPMVALCQPLAPVLKWLVVSPTEAGATSSTSPMGPTREITILTAPTRCAAAERE